MARYVLSRPAPKTGVGRDPWSINRQQPPGRQSM